MGIGNYGQENTPTLIPGLSNVTKIAVAAGGQHTLALLGILLFQIYF